MTTHYQPGLRVSEYLLEERVGVGTFGEVWRARHHIWEREHVAIKLPTQPDYVTYLQREGMMVHGLRHENIIRVLGLDPYADTPYLVMELVRGPSLKQVIAEHPRGISISAALLILRGVLNAMVVAHAANVLHRDLKPGNVMLNLEGRPLSQLRVADVKIGDFGLGLGGGAGRTVLQSASLDRGDRLVGTLAYMAPELRDEDAAPDARSDLFSIGVLLFELLCGERPAGAEVPSTLRAEVPGWLDGIFSRLYARHERRFASASEVLSELQRAESRQSTYGPPPVPSNDARSVQHGGLPPLPAKPREQPAAHEHEPRMCPSCQLPVLDSDQFCTRCGRQLVRLVRNCPKCGAYPEASDRFCIFCGMQLPVAAGG